MTTAQTPTHDRPLRAVWTPHDTEQTRLHVEGEKGRWRAFLTAKGLLLGYLKATASVAAKAMRGLHLDAAARMIKRTAGWLFGGLSLVRRGLSTAGVRPGIAWLLTTSIGQGLIARAARAVAAVARTAASTVKAAVGWCLRLFGSRGKRLASQIDARIETVRVWATKRTQPLLLTIGALLDPQGLPMQSLGTFAKGKALSALLTRFLPRPWDILARVLANVAVLPASIRRQALRLLTGWTQPEPVTPEGPKDDPTPPEPAADAVRPADLLDLEQQRIKHQDVQEGRELASLERYPAKRRSTNAKRKR